MHSYVQPESASVRNTFGNAGAAEQAGTHVALSPARESAGAKLLNESPQSQSLLRTRQALDQGPRVQSQLTLRRALNRHWTGPALADRAEDSMLRTPRRPNATGLPDGLKVGIERLSGFALNDVRVHYNSTKPAQLQAWAYTQGSDIHIGPGQDQHLAHEAWHVVQQKQGRVKPTLQMKGVAINDDDGLEREADVMGAEARQEQSSARLAGMRPTDSSLSSRSESARYSPQSVIQGYFKNENGDPMTDAELKDELTNYSGLTDDMIREINRRHVEKRFYKIANTIDHLLNNLVQPRPAASISGGTITRRVAAGLENYAHMDPAMMPLFVDAAESPIKKQRTLADHLSSPSRHFRTHTPRHKSAPQIVQGHQNTVMGHGPEDAVDYFNRIGHTLPRQQNRQHNKNVKNYHGLEEKYKSAASGGATKARYLSPSPRLGSHPSYYDRTHPDFDPRVPWHTYERDSQGQLSLYNPGPAPATSQPFSLPAVASPPSNNNTAPANNLLASNNAMNLPTSNTILSFLKDINRNANNNAVTSNSSDQQPGISNQVISNNPNHRNSGISAGARGRPDLRIKTPSTNSNGGPIRRRYQHATANAPYDKAGSVNANESGESKIAVSKADDAASQNINSVVSPNINTISLHDVNRHTSVNSGNTPLQSYFPHQYGGPITQDYRDYNPSSDYGGNFNQFTYPDEKKFVADEDLGMNYTTNNLDYTTNNTGSNDAGTDLSNNSSNWIAEGMQDDYDSILQQVLQSSIQTDRERKSWNS